MRKKPYVLLFGIIMMSFIVGFVLFEQNQFIIGLTDDSDLSTADSLQDGVDNYGLSFSTGGYAYWYYTTSDYYVGGDSLRSGSIGHSQYTYVYTTVTGPGTISFYWKVSSESGCDYLRFYIDGSTYDFICGSVSWQYESFSVSSGSHTLKWEYSKDGSVVVGSDCGWIDYVQWSGSGSGGTTLSDESAVYQSYSSTTYYNYQTGYAYSGYYHVVWVQPSSSSYRDNLYLYSDSSYSYQLASSMRSSGYLNWVVVRPSSSQYYYPKIYSYSGGSAYIEWESSSSYLDVGSSVSGSLSSSECVEIYEVSLDSSKRYTFTLNTPSSGDYDLYLYHLSSGGATSYSGYSSSSTTYGSGQDESISNFDPSSTDYYLIIVVRVSGSGSFTLKLTEQFAMSPGAIVLVVFGILATIGISAGVYKKYSGQRRPAQPQRTVPVTTQAVKPMPQKFEPPKYIQKLPQYITCAYCQSKNDINGLFCSQCGSEL